MSFSLNLMLSSKSSLSFRFAAAVFLVASFSGVSSLRAQVQNAEAAERLTKPGPGPFGVLQVTFFVHRLGTDHAEGVTTLDMNGDGLPYILSGAYWYENPGPNGGEWKRHQYREAEIQSQG